MQTRLSPEQLARPRIAQIDAIMRTCVHCGFCNATCPTYALLGDELDGPRGRIYQVKSWLEEDRAPTASDAKHIDRCLSCLACVTTCPSGVDYMHLIDYARAEVESSPARTRIERLLRAALGHLLTNARLFRHALRLGRIFRRFARFAPARVRALLELLPESAPGRDAQARRVAPATLAPSQPRRRVALLRGCVQDELRPQINDAALRVLARLGCEVHELSSAHCCGALVHHLGQAQRAHATAAATARELRKLVVEDGVDTIVSSASGCGTMLKDYAQVLRDSEDMSSVGADIAARTRDLGELIGELGGVARWLESGAADRSEGLRVAVHSPCSIHHGQRLGDHASALLAAAGYATSSLPDPHMCCGSAGVYNVLQPQLARELRARKVDLIRRSGVQVVATANIGCLMQLRAGLRDTGLDTPVVHAIELIDAAMGDQKSE